MAAHCRRHCLQLGRHSLALDANQVSSQHAHMYAWSHRCRHLMLNGSKQTLDVSQHALPPAGAGPWAWALSATTQTQLAAGGRFARGPRPHLGLHVSQQALLPAGAALGPGLVCSSLLLSLSGSPALLEPPVLLCTPAAAGASAAGFACCARKGSAWSKARLQTQAEYPPLTCSAGHRLCGCHGIALCCSALQPCAPAERTSLVLSCSALGGWQQPLPLLRRCTCCHAWPAGPAGLLRLCCLCRAVPVPVHSHS